MANNGKPARLTLCAYNVGFGDCFLLSFHYSAFDRHVLIDFGSSSAPKGVTGDYMRRIALDIRTRCKGKLDAVVVTHRHRDHLSGFATGEDGPGKIIAGLNPDVVVQPWTEAPDAPANFAGSLGHMQKVAANALTEAGRLGIGANAPLHFVGEQNLPNESAVVNLMEMGRKGAAAYVHCGSDSGLGKVLPGVKVHVLGPPTLEQSDSIRNERERDPAEFWQFQAFWKSQALAGQTALFPRAPVYRPQEMPPAARWFVGRARRMRGEQLMDLVRELDDVLNNTSVILLFEVGPVKLLFPGDAQIENWAYALAQPQFQALLRDVEVYKVGHHGSLNATPKSLWNLFTHRHEGAAPGRLQTVLSTKPGKHGSVASHTEVPRTTLVTELKRESDCFSTQDLAENEIAKFFEYNLGLKRAAKR